MTNAYARVGRALLAIIDISFEGGPLLLMALVSVALVLPPSTQPLRARRSVASHVIG